MYVNLNFSPKIIDQSATKTGVVVVKRAISHPCKYLNALIKHKYITPNWIAPIKRIIINFLKFTFLTKGKKIIIARIRRHKTTKSLGKTANWFLINPNDNEKQIVAKIR